MVLNFFADVARTLGFSGVLWAILGLILFAFAVKAMDRLERLLGRLGKHWRRAPAWRKQAYVVIGIVLFWQTLWQWFPKTSGGLALVLGFGTVWWLGGLMHLRRYGLLASTPTRGWRHHIAVTRAAKHLTKAHEDASTKKGGRARKPTPGPTGMTYVAEPGDGQSAAEFAEEVNDGKHKASTARRLGWDEVRSQKATVLPDGTVLVSVDSVDVDGDSLTEERWWGG